MRAIVLALCLIVFSTGGLSAAQHLIDARLGIHPDKTRLVLELRQQPRWRVFALNGPPRVVVDLPRLSESSHAALNGLRRGVVAGIRTGRFRRDVSRIVLDLQGPAHIRKVFRIPPRGGHSHRLVVDMARLPRGEVAPGHQLQLAGMAMLPELLPPRPASKKPTPPKRPPDRRKVVVLDPGHGGHDPGATSISGVHEKHIVLKAARAIARRLEATGQFRVILTRTRDTFVGLDRRRELARDAGADLFLSIHADAHETAHLRGASVYTVSAQASDRVAGALAQAHNGDVRVNGVALEDTPATVRKTLVSLAQRRTMTGSRRLARSLVAELAKVGPMLGNPHRSAGFVVLKAIDVPSALIELGFLSNPRDAKLLLRPDHRDRLAAAVVRGVQRWFATQGLQQARLAE